MKIKMLTSCNGSSNAEGSVSMTYKKDDTYDMSQEWQVKVANSLIAADLAMEVKDEVVQEEKKSKEKKPSKKGKFSL
tara:strand:- start:516 stop:746 length:231 start_codon:yes stop_codon:yes gene_type:complete